MIIWRDNKASFVGASKRLIKGFFKYVYSVTTASVTIVVPAERVYIVANENRTQIISAENRTEYIAAEKQDETI